MKKTYIIAEIGVNHNGDVLLAQKMIDAAFAVGADCVKFQTFFPDKGVTRNAPKAEYQQRVTTIEESHFEMLKKLELSYDTHVSLLNYCQRKKIDFLSSPFDCEGIDLLYRLGLETIKVPSGEITNVPYLRKVGSLGKKIILSTGMSDMTEILAALSILQSAGTQKENITVLQCTSAYPTPYEDVHLRAMEALRDQCGTSVGYSDHTLGIEVPIAAVALGASVIEKHFTLSRTMDGPDHKASLEPGEFKKMVDAIRTVERALGSRMKCLSPSEVSNRAIIRKSIVATQQIKKGDFFTLENIMPKRPAGGIDPSRWDDVIGRKAIRDFNESDLIEIE